MKKIIRTGDLCCDTCAKRIAEKLELIDGVCSARANAKKQVILVEVESDAVDDKMIALIKDAGFEVKSIEQRKGIFY